MKGPQPSRTARWVERLLQSVAGADVAEAAWGDLMEEAAEVARRRGPTIARLWIGLHSLGLILRLMDGTSSTAGRWPGEVTMDEWSERRRRTVAWIGVLAAAPAALLVLSGLIYSFSPGGALAKTLDSTLFDPAGVGFRVVLHPAVILGGLAVAVALNLIPLVRLSVEAHGGTATATLGLRVRPRHLAIAAVAFGLLSVIAAYGFVENFDIVAGEGMRSLRALAVLLA